VNASCTFVVCEGSAASSNAAHASASGTVSVNSDMTSARPPPISATASANSAWKRNVPRSSIPDYHAPRRGHFAARDPDLHHDPMRTSTSCSPTAGRPTDSTGKSLGA
jgi:hypothetical protein